MAGMDLRLRGWSLMRLMRVCVCRFGRRTLGWFPLSNFWRVLLSSLLTLLLVRRLAAFLFLAAATIPALRVGASVRASVGSAALMAVWPGSTPMTPIRAAPFF